MFVFLPWFISEPLQLHYNSFLYPPSILVSKLCWLYTHVSDIASSFSFYYCYPKDYQSLVPHLFAGLHYQIGLSRNSQPNICWQFYELSGGSLCLIPKSCLLSLLFCSDESVKSLPRKSPKLVALQTWVDTIFALRALGFCIWEITAFLKICESTRPFPMVTTVIATYLYWITYCTVCFIF